MSTLELLLDVVGVVTFFYFACLTPLSLFFTVVAWRAVMRSMHAQPHAAMDDAFASPLTPGISMLVPAYNEEAGIVEGVRSLVDIRYPRFEVIVVNDGSTDATLARLREEFDLVPAHRTLRGKLATKPVRGVYRSRRRRDFYVIDKQNGGKSDALNAGVDAAHYPYVCALDADGVIEGDALLRVAKPILDDPHHVVATGGTVRIANGCRIDHGRVVNQRLPKKRLVVLQVIEYFRIFLVGRVSGSALKSLLIISGAFGLFRRSLIEEVGGYSTETVGEDMELVLRLHRHLRHCDGAHRIEFVPEPVCWTEAPEDLRSLARQRRRGPGGRAASRGRHPPPIGQPRDGARGVVGLAVLVVVECLGAAHEGAGGSEEHPTELLGGLSLEYMVAFFALSGVLGVLLSVAALVLDEFSFRRYKRGRDVGRLVAYAVFETFGYRQLVAFWRTLAYFDLARGKKDWGRQRRHGIGDTGPATDGERNSAATESVL